MIKKIALTAATVASLGFVAVSPAMASIDFLPQPTPEDKPVPEPLTILGSLAVGGGLVASKLKGKKN